MEYELERALNILWICLMFIYPETKLEYSGVDRFLNHIAFTLNKFYQIVQWGNKSRLDC